MWAAFMLMAAGCFYMSMYMLGRPELGPARPLLTIGFIFAGLLCMWQFVEAMPARQARPRSYEEELDEYDKELLRITKQARLRGAERARRRRAKEVKKMLKE